VPGYTQLGFLGRAGEHTLTPDSEKTSLGKTDLQTLPMGIGVWAWGDSVYWGYGRNYTEADIKAAFEACLEVGLTLFDTAESYGQGRSERLLGQFIQTISPEKASTLLIATKFFPYPWRIWKGSLRLALQNSLKRLQRSQVELYQIHWPFPPLSVETWASALADVVAEGLAKAVGVSNYNASQMRRAHAVLIKRGLLLSSNQVEYSLLDRRVEKNGLLAQCHELGITCIAYSPIAKGVLSGKYSSRHPLSGLRSRKYPGKYLNQIEPLIRLLQEIGQSHDDKTPAQVAINWVICKGALPIPGVKTLQQAQENLGALGWRLSEDEVAALDHMTHQIHL